MKGLSNIIGLVRRGHSNDKQSTDLAVKGRSASAGSESGPLSSKASSNINRDSSSTSNFTPTSVHGAQQITQDANQPLQSDRTLVRQQSGGGSNPQRVPSVAPKYTDRGLEGGNFGESFGSAGDSTGTGTAGTSRIGWDRGGANSDLRQSASNYSFGMLHPNSPFPDLPPFREAPQSERVELFRKKLQACATVYDFNRPNTHLKEKETKKQTLLEIVEYVNNTRSGFNETVMPHVIEMVSSNIFRSLPPTSIHAAIIYEPEEEEPTLESSWPHLQIVYEFFLRFVVSNDVDQKAAKRYIDQQFVLKLLDLFNSEDPRERDYLKTILHRIYGKIMPLRSFIRKAIQHVFFKFIYENEEAHNGISELLEILGSIINGFALPLKEEHKLFLSKSLIPLHKARGLSLFHQQLGYCMSQYVEKDSRLAESIIMGLLRYWPVTNTPKEVMFLNELEEILELTQPAEFHSVMELLFKKMAACIQSPHFQVAERVLFLWHNDQIVKMINQNKKILFPIIISALYKNSKEHWNNTVAGLTFNVSKLLAEADPSLFDDCSDKNVEEEKERQDQEDRRRRKWAELQSMYDSKMAAGEIFTSPMRDEVADDKVATI